MSVHNPLPITIVQMGHVEKLAEVAQNQTTVQQQVTQEETARKMREKNVEPTLPASEGKINDEGGPRQQAADTNDNERQNKRKVASAVPEPQSDEPSEPDSPFTGIIVNIKV